MAAIRNHPQLISEAFIDCLVRLHLIDIVATGLMALGKPEGFLERQVRGWAERWRRAKTEDEPEMDRIIAWLTMRMPKSTATTIVHNDYKLDNVMFRNGSAKQIEAVLDWEMSTIGDPLVDVGLTLCYWSWLGAPELRAAALPAFTTGPGWYDRERFIARYAERTGRDMSQIAYYEVLGMFKLAVILQQIFYRFHRGQTSDQRFRDFDKRVHGLIRLAASLVEKQG
jgi:aminoglycoside phosphotransferase (APT) family kinase protein